MDTNTNLVEEFIGTNLIFNLFDTLHSLELVPKVDNFYIHSDGSIKVIYEQED